jgi:hypothetical protein
MMKELVQHASNLENTFFTLDIQGRVFVAEKLILQHNKLLLSSHPPPA